MKCVVTGASGHVGNVLVRELVKKGYEVTALIHENENIDYLKELNVVIKHGDVRDLKSLEDAFRGNQIVFHLAGIVDIGSMKKNLIYDVNVNGTKNVYEACKKEKIKRLVYTSSVHAIPEKRKGETITETKSFSSKLVKGTYAKTKAEATKFLLENYNDDMEIVIVHPSGIIGPYEYITTNLGQLIIDAAHKKIGAYLEGGYDFVDVRDVVNGIILAAEKGKNGECYILSGHYISVKDLLQKLEEITNVKAPKFKIARWFAYITGFFAELHYKRLKQKPLFTSYSVYTLGTNSNFSSEKAKKELGYKTRELDETLIDTVNWFKKQGKI